MTTPEEPVRPFQVDLRGVVDLLSHHLYSSPRVYLRELLQNGVDALTMRGELDPGAILSGITIRPPGPGHPELVVTDDGIGLTAAEVARVLSTVGASSKRGLATERGHYLGQFGIGLLACFMVADTIVVRSRSARGGAAVEWHGHTDGTFTVRASNPA